MKKILAFFRVKEWLVSKCSLLVSVMLYCCIKNTEMAISMKLIANFVAYLIFIIAFLAFGYVINDYGDMEIDKKAGKKKIICELPRSVSIGILWVLVLIANLPLICLNTNDFKLYITMVATFFLGMSYSLKPLRFKERGVFGLIVSSVAQRCMPILVLYELLPMEKWELVSWQILSFFIGLRYILIHQKLDKDNDVSTGTTTFANRHERYVDEGIVFSLFIEIVMLLVLFKPWKSVWISIGFSIYFLYSIIQIIAVKKVLFENAFFSFSCVPFEDFYNFYMPLILIIRMMPLHLFYVMFFIIFISVTLNFIKDKLGLMLGLFTPYRK